MYLSPGTEARARIAEFLRASGVVTSRRSFRFHSYTPTAHRNQPRNVLRAFGPSWYLARPMNKKEVAAELGISLRSVENYSKKGQLSVRYEKGARGDVAVYDPSEVRALKAVLQARTAIVPTVIHERPEAITRTIPESTAIALRRPTPAPPILPPSELAYKLLLTLSEASLLTGLGKWTLNQARKEERLKAVRLGGSFRFRPDDLKDFIANL
jgi:excisionase family DNA binding protein